MTLSVVSVERRDIPDPRIALPFPSVEDSVNSLVFNDQTKAGRSSRNCHIEATDIATSYQIRRWISTLTARTVKMGRRIPLTNHCRNQGRRRRRYGQIGCRNKGREKTHHRLLNHRYQNYHSGGLRKTHHLMSNQPDESAAEDMNDKPEEEKSRSFRGVLRVYAEKETTTMTMVRQRRPSFLGKRRQRRPWNLHPQLCRLRRDHLKNNIPGNLAKKPPPHHPTMTMMTTTTTTAT